METIISVTKHAWDIRRNIAERSGKTLMQVSWGTCYRLAYKLAHPRVRYQGTQALESHFLPKEKPSKGIIRKALATIATLI